MLLSSLKGTGALKSDSAGTPSESKDITLTPYGFSSSRKASTHPSIAALDVANATSPSPLFPSPRKIKRPLL